MAYEFVKDMPPDVRLYCRKHVIKGLAELKTRYHAKLWYNVTVKQEVITQVPLDAEELEQWIKAYRALNPTKLTFMDAWSPALLKHYCCESVRIKSMTGIMNAGFDSRYDFVVSSFNWDDSVKGHEFWYDVSVGRRDDI